MMSVVSAKVTGWQKLCWKLAQGGMAFEVQNVTTKQIVFLLELCAAYGYKYKVVGGTLQLFPPSLIANGVNKEIEAELKKLLQKIANSKKQPDTEVIGLCTRYIALCLQTENVSEKASEIAERILDVMEFLAKRNFNWR